MKINLPQKKIIALMLIVLTGYFLLAPVVLAANLIPAACVGDQKSQTCGLCEFIQLFINGADIIVGLSGTVSIVFIIYGGFWMLTAYGNQQRYQHGKDAIVATVIGILIVLFAWTLVNLVILSLYGGNTGLFQTFAGHAWNGPCNIVAK